MAVVSIVMPVHNRERLVRPAIESVLRQRFVDFELLAVDDHSTDQTLQVLERFAARDERVRVVRARRRGVSAARNAGLEVATGEIVAYLDSDNTWRDDHLERVVAQLRGRTRASCYTKLAVRVLDARGHVIRETVLANPYDRSRLLRGNQIDLNAFAHTAQLYALVGGFDERMDRLVDWDFILRVTERAPPELIDAVTGDYLHHQEPGRISRAAHYNKNRLAVALKHRLGPGWPRILLFGTAPDPVAYIRWRDRGLPVEHVDKRRALSGRLAPTANDIVIWAWSPWDDEGDRLQRVVARFIRRTAVSFYWLSGASPGQTLRIADPGVARGFDFLVTETVDDKARLAAEIEHRRPEPEINPADTVLVARDPRHEAEDVRTYVDRIARYGFEDLMASFVAIDPPPNVATDVERLGERLRSFGFGWADHSPPDDAARVDIVFDSTPGPLLPKARGWTVLWCPEASSEIRPERLAEVDLVVVDSRAQATALEERYPGLRVVEWGIRPGMRAQALLRAVGRLVSVRHPDGVPEGRRPRLLWLHGRPGANTTRKRVFEIGEALRGLFEVRWLGHAEATIHDIVGADLVIIQRWTDNDPDERERVFQAMAALKPCGKTFVYEIDDLIFRLGDGTPIRFMEAADAVFTSTRQLAEFIRPHNPNVWVLPNAIDAPKLTAAPSARLDPARKHVIVASSDALGLEQVLTIASEVARTHPDVRFHFMSYLCEPPEHPHVVFHPVMPIERLFAFCREAVALLNLGYPSTMTDELLAQSPEAFEAFVNSKSEVKFQLAGLARTVLVTTSKPVIYQSLVRSGENGIIADDLNGQVAALRRLLDDEALRNRLTAQAYAEIWAGHTVAQRWPLWRDAILEVNARRLQDMGR